MNSVAIGQKFGKWEVISAPQWDAHGHQLVMARCKCGLEKLVRTDGLLIGRSSGCPKCRTTHGESRTKLHGVWGCMLNRCRDENSKPYKNYGGRGIKVCQEWLDFPTFRKWALANGYKEGLEIDRRDNDGNYEPGNCRWVTTKENCNNKRTNVLVHAFGEIKTLSQWSEDRRCVVAEGNLRDRIRRWGWDAEAAITTFRNDQFCSSVSSKGEGYESEAH